MSSLPKWRGGVSRMRKWGEQGRLVSLRSKGQYESSGAGPESLHSRTPVTQKTPAYWIWVEEMAPHRIQARFQKFKLARAYEAGDFEEAWSETKPAPSVLLNNRVQRFGEAVGMVGGIVSAGRDAHAAAAAAPSRSTEKMSNSAQQALCKGTLLSAALGLARDPERA